MSSLLTIFRLKRGPVKYSACSDRMAREKQRPSVCSRRSSSPVKEQPRLEVTTSSKRLSRRVARWDFSPAICGLYHRLTPRETLTFFGRLSGLKEALLRERIDQLFSLFDMKQFADTKIDALSTGMRQKTALTRTLVHDPPIFILDEPTSGLDVPSAHVVERFIRDAKDDGKCIVLSTHVMEEAEYLCDRIAVIHQGKIRALGTMDQLRTMTGKQRLREIFLELLGMNN